MDSLVNPANRSTTRLAGGAADGASLRRSRPVSLLLFAGMCGACVLGAACIGGVIVGTTDQGGGGNGGATATSTVSFASASAVTIATSTGGG